MTEPPLKNQRKPRGRGRPFTKGQSGNPKGKPPGTKSRVTRAAEVLLEGEAEALTRVAVEKALEGDVAALRLCLDRCLPVRRGATVHFELPNIETTADLPRAVGALIQLAGTGALTPDEAVQLAGLLDNKRRAFETNELEKRLSELEKSLKEAHE